ncbi:hypothetical protein BC828DRAFT_380515 [Blastocladiella britannica]|nr:hypothetical protein BC828DRAFT_380515 [Blastocladiella britannica]
MAPLVGITPPSDATEALTVLGANLMVTALIPFVPLCCRISFARPRVDVLILLIVVAQSALLFFAGLQWTSAALPPSDAEPSPPPSCPWIQWMSSTSDLIILSCLMIRKVPWFREPQSSSLRVPRWTRNVLFAVAGLACAFGITCSIAFIANGLAGVQSYTDMPFQLEVWYQGWLALDTVLHLALNVMDGYASASLKGRWILAGESVLVIAILIATFSLLSTSAWEGEVLVITLQTARLAFAAWPSGGQTGGGDGRGREESSSNRVSAVTTPKMTTLASSVRVSVDTQPPPQTPRVDTSQHRTRSVTPPSDSAISKSPPRVRWAIPTAMISIIHLSPPPSLPSSVPTSPMSPTFSFTNGLEEASACAAAAWRMTADPSFVVVDLSDVIPPTSLALDLDTSSHDLTSISE